MTIEKRFSPVAYDAAGTVRGTVLKYGDIASIAAGDGTFKETVLPGAFGPVSDLDVILNVQHERGRPLARTATGPYSGGLTLEDGQDALTMRAGLPDTVDGRDARTLLETGVLRGLSVEMIVTDDEINRAAMTRTIRRADLLGMGLVDRPAYSESGAVLARFRQDGYDTEDRAAFTGFLEYGFDVTVADTGAIRKRRYEPNCFSYSINDAAREISLQVGNDPGKVLASKLAGSLKLKDGPKRLGFTVPGGLPDTGYSRDLRAQLDAGAVIGVTPLYRLPPADKVPNATAILPEPGNPGVFIESIKDATLYALSVRARPPDKGQASGVKEARGVLAWL